MDKRGRPYRQYSGSNQRARRYGAVNTLTFEQWLKILHEANGVCAYCKQQIGEALLCLEHIVPLCKGGKNSLENITVACFRCNSIKQSRDQRILQQEKIYPVIKRKPTHYDITDIANLYQTSVASIKVRIRKGKIAPIGVCASDGLTLLFDAKTYNKLKKEKEFWNAYSDKCRTKVQRLSESFAATLSDGDHPGKKDWT